MKSVQEFFSESNRREVKPTSKGRSAAIDALSRIFNSPSSGRSELTSKEIIDAARTKGGSAAAPRSAPEAGVWLGSDDQAIRDAREILRKQAQRRASKSAAAASDVSQELKTQAYSTAAKARETKPQQRKRLGDVTKGGPVKVTTLKPSQPAPAPKPETIKQSSVSKQQAAYRRKIEKQAGRIIKDLQGKSTARNLARGYDSALERTADDIIKGIGAERKAETAAGNREFKQQRYGKGKSGPATNLRTPAQTRTYQTGVKKGYFDPKTGRVSSSGLQRHINMRAVGGENFGKFKGKDPREALAKVSDAIKRAQSGDRAARSEIRRSYKSITAKYKPETGARAARTGGSEGFRTFQQQATNTSAPKLTPQKMSMPLPGTQQRPVSSPATQATKQKLRQKLDLKLQARSQKGGALGFPVETGISRSKSGQLAPGTKGGKISIPEPIKPVNVADITTPEKLSSGSTKTSTSTSTTTRTTTKPQPGRAPSTYRGTGTGRVEVSAPPKTPTPILTPGQQTATKTTTATGSAKPKEIKIPKPTKKPNVTPPKRYSDFIKQTGTTSTRKGSWTYSPSPSTTATQKKVAQSLKDINPIKYQRAVQKRAENISSIKTNRALGALGNVANIGFAGYDAYEIYKKQREAGQSKEYATKRAAAEAGGGAVGADIGATIGSKIGRILPGKYGKAAGLALGLAGGAAGYIGGSQLGKAALGASKQDKDWMKWATRKTQTGTAADAAQFKTGNKAIIRDKSGKERVGYRSYEGGKEVYKHGADPSSLRYTSNNPLERIGRTVAQSNLGPVSDWVKSRYAASDEAARKKRVAAVKSASSK